MGWLWVRVYLAGVIQRPQACNQLKVKEKQTSGLELCTSAAVFCFLFFFIMNLER